MKIKTSELIGKPLDWAAAKCDDPEMAVHIGLSGMVFDGYHYSTDWSQGGPIIERECMKLVCGHGPHAKPMNPEYAWYAVHQDFAVAVSGPTALIAAMRCYVASKLGDEVDVPEELT